MEQYQIINSPFLHNRLCAQPTKLDYNVNSVFPNAWIKVQQTVGYIIWWLSSRCTVFNHRRVKEKIMSWKNCDFVWGSVLTEIIFSPFWKQILSVLNYHFGEADFNMFEKLSCSPFWKIP